MARPFAQVNDVNDSKELWKITVKFHHKWSAVTNNKEHFEMVVYDCHETDIHVVVPLTYFAAFNSILTVGHTYTISNFMVVRNDLVFKPTAHRYMLKFTGGTSVNDIDKHIIPPRRDKFTIFADIITGQYKKDALIGYKRDVTLLELSIALVMRKLSPGEKNQVNFILRDHRNNTINCTLWESYALEFIKYNQGVNSASGPIVVLLQYAKVKEEGKYPLSISNTYNITKLYINADLPSIKEFMERVPKDSFVNVSGQLSSPSQIYSQNLDSSHLNPSQKILSKAVVLPLGEIVKLPEIPFCATVATTKKLIASRYGWYYQACHQCPKVARGEKPPFLCEAEHATEAAIYKYKIEIEYTYAGKICKFVFWDRECCQLLHLSAAEMRDTMIKGGVNDPLEFPLVLDVLLGLELAFKVKWKPRWDNCSVVMILRDDNFVKQLKAPWDQVQIPTAEILSTRHVIQIKESVDEAKSGPVADYGVVTDLKITFRHNPLLVTPTTKRHGGDGSSDGELSTTKLHKIVKLEKID